MPRKSKTQELSEIHAEALDEFDAVYSASRDERMQALEDRRFYSIAGAPWEGAVGEQFAQKPRFEFNLTAQAVMRAINEYRNNRITVDFVPKDDSPDDELADTCDGLWRETERRSGAQEAYDNAYEEATAGGMGAWRFRAEYEDDESEEDDRQRVCIEPIHDAESRVFFNLGAVRQDKSDAKRCWLLTPMPRADYKEEYGDAPSDWPASITKREFDWCTADVVWLCEYFVVEDYSVEVVWFEHLVEGMPKKKYTQEELDDDPSIARELRAQGYKVGKRKTVERHRVRMYLMSGGKVLKDCGYIPGKYIPVIVTYGNRRVVDGTERFNGIVRWLKDGQRLKNMLMSWMADMTGRFDIEKPIFAAEQVRKYEDMWTNDAVNRYAFLLADPLKNADGSIAATGPLAYTKAPNIPPAMAGLMQLVEGSIKDLMGNQEGGEQIQPNLSGKAVELIQQRLDMQTFIYMSNFARAMEHSGRVWMEMQKALVVEPGRTMQIVGEDGKSGKVKMNVPSFDPKRGTEYMQNDLTRAAFEVVVGVGPASTSKRAATVRALTGLASISDDPAMRKALMLATITHLEDEGLQDLRDWARAQAIREGLAKPTDVEKEQLAQEAQNTPPDAQTQYLQQAAQKEGALADQARAKTVETLESAGLKRAQTAETLANTESAGLRAMLDVSAAIREAASPPPGQGGF